MYEQPVTRALYDDNAIRAGVGPNQALISSANQAREHYGAQLACFNFKDSAYRGHWGEQVDDPALLTSSVKDWDEATRRAFAAAKGS